jgi:hypothetical protein
MKKIIDYYHNKLGWSLCQFDPKVGRPEYINWQFNPISVDDYKDNNAIGLILGPLSKGIVAVDLDFDSDDSVAWSTAREVMPITGLTDGRPGKSKSHLYYSLSDSSFASSILPKFGSEIRKMMDEGFYPFFPGSRRFKKDKRGVDFLCAGAQIVIPPSMNLKSGKRRFWDDGLPGTPLSISYNDLFNSVNDLITRLNIKKISDSVNDLIDDDFNIDNISIKKRVIRLKQYLNKVIPNSPGYGVHVQQYFVACRCAEFGVPYEYAESIYLNWTRPSGTTKSDEYLLTVLAGAYKQAVFGQYIGCEKQIKKIKSEILSKEVADFVVQLQSGVETKRETEVNAMSKDEYTMWRSK